MTWFGNNVTVGNISTDVFNRLRISNPNTIYDVQNQYGESALLFEDILSGTGSVTHLPNESSVQLSTGGTASGAKAYRQSRQYFRYHPGKSTLVLMTRNMGAIKANVRQRIGLFDTQNGLFFEQDGTSLKVVVRTYTSGTAVDNAVNQSSWNIDKMDGTGASGITLDTSKQNLYFINFQWLGTGIISFGIFYNGSPIVCHTFNYANSLTTPYMTTANLPLRNEIENTGVAASTTTMKATCNTIISEGGIDTPFAYTFAVSNGIAAIAVTTRRAILSIRPKATFNGIINRAEIDMLTYDLYGKTNDGFYELVYNPTFTGTPTWTSVSTNSTVEYSIHNDAAAGAITNGIVVDAGFIVAGQGQSTGSIGQELSTRYPLTLDNAGANPIAFSLVVTSVTGICNVAGSLNWTEEY